MRQHAIYFQNLETQIKWCKENIVHQRANIEWCVWMWVCFALRFRAAKPTVCLLCITSAPTDAGRAIPNKHQSCQTPADQRLWWSVTLIQCKCAHTQTKPCIMLSRCQSAAPSIFSVQSGSLPSFTDQRQTNFQSQCIIFAEKV